MRRDLYFLMFLFFLYNQVSHWKAYMISRSVTLFLLFIYEATPCLEMYVMQGRQNYGSLTAIISPVVVNTGS